MTTRPQTTRSRRLGALGVAIALVAVAVGFRTRIWDGVGGLTPGSKSVEVVVAASPEKATYLQRLADEFDDAGGEVDGLRVTVSIETISSGVGADALIDDWPVNDDNGRRPTVWSPAASIWGETVDHRRAADGKPAVVPDTFDKVALTPVVIAMPEPMAKAMGWPATPLGWADIASLAQSPDGWGARGHPEWGSFKLGKTNPNISTTGFNTTIAQAYAGAGKQTDLTKADLASPQVRVFLEGIESSIVHYGDTTLTFLQNLQRADERGAATGYISAVALEEKSVIDYNNGDPAGRLQPGETGAKPKTPLVAVYPKEGTLWSDNPFYVLDADWVSDEQRRGAKRFGDFVTSSEQSQKLALEFGFRPADVDLDLGAPIDPANGVDPDQPQTILPVPAGDVLADTLTTWSTVRKTAKALIVMDVSGSMGESAGDGRETKLELAQSAAAAALDELDDRDEVGLWVFSTELRGSEDFSEVAPIAPIGQNREQLKSQIRALIPLNGTGLYDTTAAAYAHLDALASPATITAMVLLTDGKNEDRTNNDLAGLLDRIDAGEGASSPVRVFAIAYGQGASVSELTEIVNATDGALYRSTDPSDIEKVFRNVISNF